METVKNKVNAVLESIGRTISELTNHHTIEEQKEYQEDFKERCYEIVELVEETYTLVSWPESQEYMEEEWFEEEAVLNHEESLAYFIPTKYV